MFLLPDPNLPQICPTLLLVQEERQALCLLMDIEDTHSAHARIHAHRTLEAAAARLHTTVKEIQRCDAIYERIFLALRPRHWTILSALRAGNALDAQGMSNLAQMHTRLDRAAARYIGVHPTHLDGWPTSAST